MGGLGFACGFIGPLGIGSTGHVGFFIGCALGVVASLLRLRTAAFLLVLAVSSAAWTFVLSF